MVQNKKNNVINDIVETGSEITGGIGSAVIGGLIAGPAGIIIGGASGPLLTKAFKVIGIEIKKRFLGSREEIRIGAAYTFALSKIAENDSKGLVVRKDDFFENKNENRPASEEILEGVIISAQKEYEERKVKYLGYLYANICSNSSVSKEQANQLIRTANSLSFRQLCMLQLLAEKRAESLKLNFKVRGLDKWEIRHFDIVAEIKDFQQKGLVFITTTFSDFEEVSAVIRLNDLHITDSGDFFCKMLSLDEIERSELDRINSITTIKETIK